MAQHLSGETPWYWPIAAVFDLDVQTVAWDLTVVTATGSAPLARRRFRRKREATTARDGFVLAVTAGLVDTSDPPAVQAALDAVPTSACSRPGVSR